MKKDLPDIDKKIDEKIASRVEGQRIRTRSLAIVVIAKERPRRRKLNKRRYELENREPRDVDTNK